MFLLHGGVVAAFIHAVVNEYGALHCIACITQTYAALHIIVMSAYVKLVLFSERATFVISGISYRRYGSLRGVSVYILFFSPFHPGLVGMGRR